MGQLNKKKIILIFFFITSLFEHVFAQENHVELGSDMSDQQNEVSEKYNKHFFYGVSLSIDLFSPIQKLFSDYGGVEAGAHANFLNTYFPVVELGLGFCNHKNGNTNIKYETSDPYFRVGLDYNILKDKYQSNILYVGARYGFSFFNFNISGPDIVDPIWKVKEPFSYSNINSNSHWIEFLAGVKIKLWHNIHMGWTIRFKHLLSSGKSQYCEPYYIPGYGTTVSSSTWGGSYSIIFDLNLFKQKYINPNSISPHKIQ